MILKFSLMLLSVFLHTVTEYSNKEHTRLIVETGFFY